ncbi:N-acetylglucosamine kinase-like BadF-type ATPase [Virgibacillus natechei]|uniref:N-acetylglucosamine kinase-like BadF-type ATPase n=1 Tax=Virgibacillus natechei TaxID=1216297 RepID=A0ABS4IKP0_9BACI|nr:BadF/BadG/BcrA/BcrD ATPase family protein [Virgibacillus natechei]MBP1971542.1 N-acetylglucosamine kinase-like BadF-type ATPase [Virgibacillus natechei]UZD11988.1 hypothetical protein OLD84_13705 [Virgibacillus natechei]
MSYVMGIDGGGTKTKAVIADRKGRVLAQHMVGPTNPNIVSEEELKDTLEILFTSLERKAPIPFQTTTCLFAGISGAGNDKNKRVLHLLIEQFVPGNIAVQVEVDTINALYSGTYGAPGIVQISGTGSITYGINRHLEHDRVGGWGYLFGDEGSGYDIGRKGLIAALKAVDGRGSETIMLPWLYTHFNVSRAQDLIQKIYSSPTPKNKIAPLAKIVFQAYKQKDPLACKILAEAAKEITFSIKTLYEKQFEVGEKVDVVLCGGVFNDEHVLPRLIKENLSKYPTINVILPEISPVGGALIGAYLMQDIDLDEAIITTIRNTI